jgi:hypothetical protein
MLLNQGEADAGIPLVALYGSIACFSIWNIRQILITNVDYNIPPSAAITQTVTRSAENARRCLLECFRIAEAQRRLYKYTIYWHLFVKSLTIRSQIKIIIFQEEKEFYLQAVFQAKPKIHEAFARFCILNLWALYVK